jgi:AP-1 complex subunit beta-1
VLRVVDVLQDMLSDANPMVVANAIAALQEIQEIGGKEVLQITSHTLFKLLAALNECTEWGQVCRAQCRSSKLSNRA